MHFFRSFLPASTLLVVLLLSVYVGTGASFVSAQTATSSVQSQIDVGAAEIERLKQEIAALQKELNATTEQKQTLESAIKSLDLNIQKLQKSISLTTSQITQKDKEIKGLSGDISDTSTDIDQSRAHIAKSLRELDGMGNTPPAVTALLGDGTLSSFFDLAITLTSLRSELQNRVEDLSSLRTNLVTTKTSAESKRRELANLKVRLANEQKGLSAAKTAQTQLLKETANKEGNYQKLIAEKQAEQVAFERALFELASGLTDTFDPSKIPSAGSGVLRWPLDNVFITQQFGKTSVSGRLYSSGTHDGMDFRASIGTPVRAALIGTVLEVNHGAVVNCQYGKWVLIRHPNGLSTLYAHLSEVSVNKGSSVSTGQVIGYAGNTGYATGPHLHFTVYASDAVAFKSYSCKNGRSTLIPIATPGAYLNPLSYLPR